MSVTLSPGSMTSATFPRIEVGASASFTTPGSELWHPNPDHLYVAGPIYDECHRRRIRLVCPLKSKDKARDGHRVPTCRHGRREYRWKYVGTDINRGTHGASKWRCPAGLCRPRSVWVALDRFHTAIPRDTGRSHATYDHRTAIERLWARLKREWGFLELRVRGQDRVAQHVDLIVLAHLMFGLAKLRAP